MEEENRKRPVTDRLLYAALLLKAVALAVREVPELNGFWTDDIFRASPDVHVGIAISLRTGRLVEPDVSFREQLDLDSLDFLNFAIGVHEALGTDIPEIDYSKLATLDGCVSYLIRAPGRLSA